VVQRHYGALLTGPRFQTNKKWSIRVRETFGQQGKLWNDRIEAEVKRHVAEAVASQPASSLLPATRSAFDALVVTLRDRLQQLQGASRDSRNATSN
jgi:hypothetical protein